MSHLLKEKRSTRGMRMSELVGEALDQDTTFYGADVWDEEESDDSYDENDFVKEMKPDEFDSDFNDTEDDDNSDDDSEEEGVRRNERSANRKEGVGGRYKEPVKVKPAFRPKVVATPTSSSSSSSINCIASTRFRPTKIRRIDPSLNPNISVDMAQNRSVRSSTISKTVYADRMRILAQKKARSRAPMRPPIKHTFTQKELLLDALLTEESNERWLRKQKELSKDLGTVTRNKNPSNSCLIRYSSKRGTYDTITFTETEAMPSILTSQKVPAIPEKNCVITGLPAKYRDPVTNYPFATLDALKEIKHRYHKHVQGVGRSRSDVRHLIEGY